MINKIAALVPMKGHSERIPNKNVRIFNGKPLFYWIIKSLSKSKYIKNIYIDTDSETITKLVRKHFSRVEIIKRRSDLIGDFISMNKIIEYDLTQIKNYNYFLQTHSTNPLLSTKTINLAIEQFMSSKRNDSLFTVNKYQSRFYDYRLRPINHEPNKLIRTQDLKPIYEENSCLYLFSRKSFMESKSRIGNTPLLFSIDKIESIDIDTKEEFKLARMIKKIAS